jgi:nitrogenase-stabilizing/protective protein
MNEAQTLERDLAELESAEDFLDYFGVQYDAALVQVNRLHILQRYHDYLAALGTEGTIDPDSRRGLYRQMLARAYRDFVTSDARTEQVFEVFRRAARPAEVTIPIAQLRRRCPR